MSIFRSSPSTHTVTVWRHWDEWSACHAALFPSVDTPEARLRACRQEGVDSVRAWRARGRVPLAVDCTVQLIELNLQHAYPPSASPGAVTPAPPCSSLASRHQYSLCLLRLVNGILDPQQSKQHAQSINTLAKQVHMPRILVDMRHESTHQQLPSLPLLQLASIAALEWLQRHYWHAQAHALSKTEDALRGHLRAFKKALDRSAEANGAAALAARAARDAAIAVSINSGDTILLSEHGNSNAGPASLLPERAQDALKALFSALTSGHTLAHTKAIVESKLLPMLLSDHFMLKPPKQSRVSLPSVFRRLVETYDAALLFLAHRFKSQQLNLPCMLLSALVTRMAAAGARPAGRVANAAPGSEWELDLLREWSLHLLQTQAAVIFREEHSGSTRADATPSKKRSHAAMQEHGVDASRVSPLDSIMHVCLKRINPWIAPLLPLLLPLFKQHHADRLALISQLEMLLHVTTRSLYPNHRVPAPKENARTAQSATPVSVAPADPAAAIRAFIATHGAAGKTASVAAPAASALKGASAPSRVPNFPFLPLGVAPMATVGDLWLEDVWIDPLAAPAPAASPVAPAAPVPPAPVEADDENEQPQVQQEVEPEALQEQPQAKRPRVDSSHTPAPANPSPAHQAGLLRLQQSLHFM